MKTFGFHSRAVGLLTLSSKSQVIGLTLPPGYLLLDRPARSVAECGSSVCRFGSLALQDAPANFQPGCPQVTLPTLDASLKPLIIAAARATLQVFAPQSLDQPCAKICLRARVQPHFHLATLLRRKSAYENETQAKLALQCMLCSVFRAQHRGKIPDIAHHQL